MMNSTTHLLLLACCCCCCSAQQLLLGPPALSQLTLNDRGDVTISILGPEYKDNILMIDHPGGTGMEASANSLTSMIMQIDRWTAHFRTIAGDVHARTAMFVGCSSGSQAANVWHGAVGRTWDKCVGNARQHTIGDEGQCYGLMMFKLNVASVRAGGEVMTGQSSLLSPEHTVTIPLSDYTFTDTPTARGLNCGGGSATPRADGTFVIYIGLYGNRGDAPLPVPRTVGAQPGQVHNPLGLGGPRKGSTWKRSKAKTCLECDKSGHRCTGKLNDEQLHDTCVAKYNKKQKAKKENGGFMPIWLPDDLRKRKRDDYDNDTDSGGGGGGGSSRLPMGAFAA
jgi:hypothetical protein